MLLGQSIQATAMAGISKISFQVSPPLGRCYSRNISVFISLVVEKKSSSTEQQTSFRNQEVEFCEFSMIRHYPGNTNSHFS
jgi:hypothetical protein